jgi:hypothetical protein
MKKYLLKIFFASLIIFVLPISAFAHPGRTDSSGCHTCKTNCEQWGLSYGEYHCHNKELKEARTEAPKKARGSF